MSLAQVGVKRVLSQCAKQKIQTYQPRLQGRGSLWNRLDTLVSIRNEEGYMAEVHRQKDGSFLLVENHCAISAAANVCARLCDAELEVFRAILGQGVVIERTEHMIMGARRCVYRIRSAKR